MFDVGFSELMMVGLVALLVIGPEKLPKVARTAGLWIGKSRNLMATFQAEIKQELQAEEMRQLLEQQKLIVDELQQELVNSHQIVIETSASVESGTEIRSDLQHDKSD